MPKINKLFVAIVSIIIFKSAAHAANAVQVTLTSPAIVKTGCEKAGAVNFSFESGSVMTVGDYWYMDLPENVTFCKAIDYVIVREDGFSGSVRIKAADPSFGFFSSNDMGFLGIGTDSVGPLTGMSNGDAGTPSKAAVSAGNVALRVKAASGQRTLYVYVIGATTGTNTLTVNNGHYLQMKVLDGKKWNVPIAGISSDTVILTDAIDHDGVFGETIASVREIIDATGNLTEPVVENSLCINSASMGGSYVNVSFSSKSDKFTFTGDSQIAHAAGANPVSLATCKGIADGRILVGGEMACNFEYESPTTGYCTGSLLFSGNRILLKTTAPFGDGEDKFDIRLTSSTPGTYFGGDPAIKAFTSSQNSCSETGTPLTATWVKYVGASSYTGAYPKNWCSTTRSNRVDCVTTTNGQFAFDPYDALHIDLPKMVFDTTIIGHGTVATLDVSLEKYPCGEVFTGRVTLGTYATSCPDTTSYPTRLHIPFLTPFDGSMETWWSGFVITNHSSRSGTITLSFYDENGNKATYTTPEISSGGQFSSSDISLASLTQDSGNQGVFGNANYAITAVCNFGLARAFVLIGNDTQGGGYVIDN